MGELNGLEDETNLANGRKPCLATSWLTRACFIALCMSNLTPYW